MKKYNIKNYVRYKEDLKQSMPVNKQYSFYNRDELIIKFMPLVENISRKFATSQEASGVMSILDIMQEGHVNLIKAVDKIDWEKVTSSDDVEMEAKTKKWLKCFLTLYFYLSMLIQLTKIWFIKYLISQIHTMSNC